MKEALLYEKTGRNVKCAMCAHRCVISEGTRGVCGVRENNGGVLYSLVYGRPCAVHIDPIEKKPLFHFLPGTKIYSISTVGCNFRCMHCQNWDISQKSKGGAPIEGFEMTPEEVVSSAIDDNCKSIAYTYTEPTVFMEYALDTSKIAVDKGLRNVFVSNGFMTPESVGLIAPYLHADNIDLKSFSDKFYREVCGGRLEPVLDTLKDMVRRKIWIEVTTLIIPTLNDSKEELKQIAEYIKKELGDHVPWHVSRFHPDYKLSNLPPTDLKKINEAYRIGKDAGLKYVYAGNAPHEDSENTRCWKCSEKIIERSGFRVSRNIVKDGKCPKCGALIEGVWS
ncbi:MAG: AmmeMemoRadiSam system radical SAM enzyme [Candidatus Altiarchaeota archaeon]|nr:AmmeMemoRadiSam system radical SAM enzyme [Candidatus Altiarchaeota archaeon]